MSKIRHFYRHKNVFVTGGTGFIGRALLHRLLHGVPDLASVTVLARPALPGRPDARARLGELAHDPRLRIVAGDLLAPALGLDAEARERLARETDVVIHLAADLGFHNDLERSVRGNVLPTLELAALAAQWPRLERLVFVSSYLAGLGTLRDGVVPEELAAWPTDPEDDLACALARGTPEHEQLARASIRTLGNTYAFSKNLAERLLVRRSPELPLLVVRPTSVVNAWRQPEPGWGDSMASLPSFCRAVLSGLVPVLSSAPRNVMDNVPVDHVANLLVAAAALLPGDGRVVHSATSCVNPVLFRTIVESLAQAARDDGFDVELTDGREGYEAAWARRLAHPALGDDARRLLVRGRRISDAYSLAFWAGPRFAADASLALLGDMDEFDRALFDFDPRQLDWERLLGAMFERIRADLGGATAAEPRRAALSA